MKILRIQKIKKEFSNLAIISCDVLGTKDNIKLNAGFFSLIIILGIFIIIFIIFCSKGYTLLKNKMDEVIYKKFKSNKKNNKLKKSLFINNKNKKIQNNKKNVKIKGKNKNKLNTKIFTSGTKF